MFVFLFCWQQQDSNPRPGHCHANVSPLLHFDPPSSEYNNSILVKWHHIPLLKVITHIYGVPTELSCYHRKWTFRLINKVYGKKKSSKSIENKCTHCALPLVLTEKHAHCKRNIRHVRYWSKAIASHFSCFLLHQK